MTTSAFTHTSPGAVRCRDCRYQPSNHGRVCETANRRVGALGAPRRCSFFEAGLPEPKPGSKADEAFDYAIRLFDDLDAAERYVLKSFREFVWQQRQGRKA